MLFICIAAILALLAALILTVIVIGTRWRTGKQRQRRILLLILCSLFLLLGATAYLGWPVSPWGRAQALQTANDFMDHLNSGDYVSAMEMLESGLQKDPGVVDDFRNPDNHPVSWELQLHPRRDSVFGSATFPDGQALPVLIYLNWQWEKACWEIDLVIFDEFGDRRIYFFEYDTGIPNEAAISIIFAVTLTSVIFSTKHLVGLLRSSRN